MPFGFIVPIALIAPALAAVTPSGTVAGPDEPRPSPAIVAAVQRDLGLTRTEALDRLADEAEARKVAATIERTLGSAHAGTWFNAATGRLHVAVSGPAGAASARASGARPIAVDRTGSQLHKTVETIASYAETRGKRVPAVVGWGVDPENNRVVVRVDRRRETRATAAFVDRVRALGSIARIEKVAWSPVQQGDVVGGEAWKPGSEGNCSIGFSAEDSGGDRHFVTAGHCTDNADQAAYGKDGTRLGTSNTGGAGSVNAREGDFGLVDVTEASWNLTAKVSGYGQGDVTVSGATEPTVGMSVCHSGVGTQWKCGEVTAVEQTIEYPNVTIEGLSITDACSAAGDSGGSYVTGSQAVGLHSGGGNGCGSSDPTTIFQPVNEALRKWDLTLETGDGQPGEVVVSGPGDQTSELSRPVALEMRASGGTPPYAWSATGLPAGLSIDASTGRISGSPTTEGRSSVSVTARDSDGKSGTTSFGWNVTAAGGGDLKLDDPGRQNAYIGRPVDLQIRGSGGSAPLTYTATGLPTGLSIDRSTGLISGTPTRWGIFGSTITASDQGGKSARISVSWNVWNAF